MPFLESIIEELDSPSDPIELVFVDWASESQHDAALATPIRDSVDYPVLQSPYWDFQGSFHDVWCDNDGDVNDRECFHALFALDVNNHQKGYFNFEDVPDFYWDLADPDKYEEVRQEIQQAL